MPPPTGRGPRCAGGDAAVSRSPRRRRASTCRREPRLRSTCSSHHAPLPTFTSCRYGPARKAASAALTPNSEHVVMATSSVPHLANDLGAEKIFVGVKELQCMGARPPFDHPHVYLDMGQDSQVLCPYCSTLYVYDARLAPDATEPADCLVDPDAGAAAA